MEAKINLILALAIGTVALNILLTCAIIYAFRLQPGNDLKERVKIAERQAAQLVHNQTNIMQTLELEQHIRRQNSAKMDKIIALLEAGKQHD